MNLNERFKKFPIKFYKTEKGIYYENSFIKGSAKDLNDAFEQLKSRMTNYELFYNYNDVIGSKVGSFEPALKERRTKNGIYLGQLNLELELDNFSNEHTVQYLSENPDKIADHEKFMKKLKDQKKRDKFISDLKAGVKKVAGILKLEFFSPQKTRQHLICEHCGDIIPTGSYYEYWHNNSYHLECIWDKLTNDTESNEHKNCIKYFLSLQKLKNWPGDLDSQENYLADLELFKSNKRKGY